MSTPPDRAEAHARDLARFQAIAMHAAEKAHEAIAAAQDVAELTALIAALSKAGRVLRMSIALEVKLGRDQARDARDAEAQDEARTRRAADARKAQVTSALDRRIWTELRPDDAEMAAGELCDQLDVEALLDGFTDEPVEAQVERIAGLLGLTGEPTQGYVPRSLRHQPHRFRQTAFRPDRPRSQAPRPRTPTSAKPPAQPPPTEADPLPGRLAPPIDPPSWESG